MRIVHFADLHLDSGFAWAGAGRRAARRRRQAVRDAAADRIDHQHQGRAARRRRQAVRDTLDSIAALARRVEADALFCGGDLYEHERVTPDTARFVQATFAALDRPGVADAEDELAAAKRRMERVERLDRTLARTIELADLERFRRVNPEAPESRWRGLIPGAAIILDPPTARIKDNRHGRQQTRTQAYNGDDLTPNEDGNQGRNECAPLREACLSLCCWRSAPAPAS